MRWQMKHNGQIPGDKDLDRILERNLDMNNEEDYDLMEWWHCDVMAMVCGYGKHWNQDKFNYLTISEGAPPGQPNKKYITSSHEAMARAFFANNREKWMEIWQLRRLDEYQGRTTFVAKSKIEYQADGRTLAWEHKPCESDDKKVWLNGPKFMGKYSIHDAGQSHDSGWNVEGRKLYLQYLTTNKEARKKPEFVQVDRAFLQKMKAKKGLTAANAEEEKKKKGKRKNSDRDPDQDPEFAMDYDEE